MLELLEEKVKILTRYVAELIAANTHLQSVLALSEKKIASLTAANSAPAPETPQADS